MVREGIIEPSDSAWSSSPVMVPKPNKKHRFCNDYRDVNVVTKKDAYPLPNIDSILDKLRIAKYISKIDLSEAYVQILMEEGSKDKTAFSVPGLGLYQFHRMPYGLINSPATFQRLMDKLIGPEFEPHVFTYLDDLIIVSENFDEHLSWLKKVLDKLMNAGLEINWKKSEFCCSSVTYLGYVIGKDGL